jgi:capsular exopolysaccharide synthesis family protein
VCYETNIPGLFMAYAGKLVPNALELLASQRFKDLLPILRQRFDYVIVDTPPLGQVIDCAVIAADLDGVVMLIDATRNSCKAEKRIRDQIEQAGGKVLGVVLNQVDFTDKFGYYGKKRYGAYAYE